MLSGVNYDLIQNVSIVFLACASLFQAFQLSWLRRESELSSSLRRAAELPRS